MQYTIAAHCIHANAHKCTFTHLALVDGTELKAGILFSATTLQGGIGTNATIHLTAEVCSTPSLELSNMSMKERLTVGDPFKIDIVARDVDNLNIEEAYGIPSLPCIKT